MEIINDDNLKVLDRLYATGEKFDLVEFDGPYMSGLEDWDCLTEDEYIKHYTVRLMIIRRILGRAGIVFIFGYPEHLAEIKSWVHGVGILRCIRWITWYKQWTVHSARKVEAILVLGSGGMGSHDDNIIREFRHYIRSIRVGMGLTIKEAYLRTGHNEKLAHKAGGFLWYETDNSRIPTHEEYDKLKEFFGLPDDFDGVPYYHPPVISGLTNIDYITIPTGNSMELGGGNTLHAKSPELYFKLFSPIGHGKNKRALILYGGSGNAAIVSEALGYETIVIEKDMGRCSLIEERSKTLVPMWRERFSQGHLWR